MTILYSVLLYFLRIDDFNAICLLRIWPKILYIIYSNPCMALLIACQDAISYSCTELPYMSHRYKFSAVVEHVYTEQFGANDRQIH